VFRTDLNIQRKISMFRIAVEYLGPVLISRSGLDIGIHRLTGFPSSHTDILLMVGITFLPYESRNAFPKYMRYKQKRFPRIESIEYNRAEEIQVQLIEEDPFIVVCNWDCGGMAARRKSVNMRESQCSKNR